MAVVRLGPPVVPFYLFLGEGFLLKSTTEKEGTLILASLLEDLGDLFSWIFGNSKFHLIR